MMRIHVLICFFIYSTVAISGSAGNYNAERLEFHDQATKILMEQKLCITVRDCQEKEYLLSTRTELGFNVQSYGIKDRNVLSLLTDELYKFYSEKGKRIEIRYRAYLQEHQTLVNKFFPTKTELFSIEFIKLSVGENEKP
jgi:uncharacterized protein YqfB (UPF0267 family)